jgi:hypothetical protein
MSPCLAATGGGTFISALAYLRPAGLVTDHRQGMRVQYSGALGGRLGEGLIRLTGFPPERFVPVDIRQADNTTIVSRLWETVESIVKGAEQRVQPV